MSRLAVLYRPGSTTLRAQLLRQLEAPAQASSALEAVQRLRQWGRYLQRARDLGIVTPDPSVLLKSIDSIVATPLQAHSQISFRMSLLRYNLQVDLRPTSVGVDSVFKGLLTEFEQIAYLKEGEDALSAKSGPQARSLEVPPPPPRAPSSTPTPSGSTGCKFFLGDQGCKKGNKCKYPHEWKDIPRQQRRSKCLVCGAVAHRAKDCKAPGATTSAPTSPTQAANPKEEVKPPFAKMVTFDPLTTSSPTATALGMPNGSSTSTSGYEMKQLMTEALEELRKLKSVDVKTGTFLAAMDPCGKKGLLDSGATHPLRPAILDELERAQKVKVTLAGDAQQETCQAQNGTILVDGDTQIIVPMGRIIQQLGLTVEWSPERCVLRSAEGEVYPLSVTRGCPELDEVQALELISRLEARQLEELKSRTASTATLVRVARMSWWAAMLSYAEEGNQAAADLVAEKAGFLFGVEPQAIGLSEGSEPVASDEAIGGQQADSEEVGQVRNVDGKVGSH